MWILGPGLFRVRGLSKSQMQVSTVILTNESNTSKIQIPHVVSIKLQPIDDNMFVISDSEDDIYSFVNLSNTLSFPFKNVHSTSSHLPIRIAKFLCGPMYMRLVSYLIFSTSSTTSLHLHL